MKGVGEERLGAGNPVAAMHPIVHTDDRETAILYYIILYYIIYIYIYVFFLFPVFFAVTVML